MYSDVDTLMIYYTGRSIFSDTVNKFISNPTKPDIHCRNTKG